MIEPANLWVLAIPAALILAGMIRAAYRHRRGLGYGLVVLVLPVTVGALTAWFQVT